jgi:hypothetical protein
LNRLGLRFDRVRGPRMQTLYSNAPQTNLQAEHERPSVFYQSCPMKRLSDLIHYFSVSQFLSIFRID